MLDSTTKLMLAVLLVLFLVAAWIDTDSIRYACEIDRSAAVAQGLPCP